MFPVGVECVSCEPEEPLPNLTFLSRSFSRDQEKFSVFRQILPDSALFVNSLSFQKFWRNIPVLSQLIAFKSPTGTAGTIFTLNIKLRLFP
jgi:hypothetical protein